MDIVKYCVEECGCDIHIDNDCYLKWAVKYEYLDIVKYIINNGFNIKEKKDKNYVLNIIKDWGCNSVYNEIKKYIEELEK